MAFRKITYIKPEPVPVVDPAQLDLEQVIAEIKEIQLKDIVVPQSEFNEIGRVYALDDYNPFGENKLVLYLNSEQSEYGKRNFMYRVYPLNADMTIQDNFQYVPSYRIRSTGISAMG